MDPFLTNQKGTKRLGCLPTLKRVFGFSLLLIGVGLLLTQTIEKNEHIAVLSILFLRIFLECRGCL